MRYTIAKVFDRAAVLSMDPVTSLEVDSTSMTIMSLIAAVTDGDLRGQIHIEVTNDGENWIDVGELIHGLDTTPQIAVAEVCFKRIRFVFYPGSGTGVLSATLKSNGLP